LAESELFGHVKGAYTGALQNRTGALLQAHNGTLFLDEIGDLSHETQVRLLRFLESGEIKAVGSDRVITADVRIVCATHLPLKDLVEQGKFRRDLYYRLASITIEIPSLRSRPEDIEMLALGYARELGKTLSPQSLNRLRAYNWPGNVRELRHAIERASGVSGPFETMLTDASFEFLFGHLQKIQCEDLVAAEPPLTFLRLDEMEKWMILKALKLCHGNRSDAAKLLGVARSTLFEMIKRHRIPGPKSQREQHKKMREELLALV
jgi:two-component system response regulator HupR/HoxA